VESKVDPRAKAPALEEKAAQAGEDMLAIWKDAAGSRHIVERDSFVLLPRVFLENYTVDAAGRTHQTRTQPTGAVHNRHESEAQWSSKSTTKDNTSGGRTLPEHLPPKVEPAVFMRRYCGHENRRLHFGGFGDAR
jgi:hypothetical protein